MPEQTRIVTPGPDADSVRAADGVTLRPPASWVLLPPGDALLTRRVKAAGPTWTVEERRGRKRFSRGVWADGDTMTRLRAEVEAERATPAYAKRLAAGQQRRAEEQAFYTEDFRGAVLAFLAFAPVHSELAERLADAVTTHATPVGSGTVARTRRIPIEQRAEAAVIAWLRHATTLYDDMTIPRVRGARREVRRQLAQQSRELLAVYRRGDPVANCRLNAALGHSG